MSAGRRLLPAAFVALVGLGVWWAFRGEPTSTRPNVLLLVMDTTRGDRCGFDGYARPTTPRLDAFAKDAVVFEDAWAPAGWTAPSHASLFTGLRPEHHGVMDGMRPFLAPGAATLATAFKDGGWRTGCFSNNDYISDDYGLAQGFETIVPLWKENNERKRAYPWAPDTHERALDWARACAAEKKPFFLFVNDMEPHLPYTPPDAFARRFLPADAKADEVAEAETFQFPASVGFVLGQVPASARKVALMSDLYDAEIATLDDAVGRLLDGLAAADLLKNTVVVVCADHGENLGEHGCLGHFQSLHRTTLHVPLVVRFPGKFDGGRSVADVVRLEDVPPTLLELCGLPPMKDVDGASLLHDLSGRAARAVQGEQSRVVPEMKKAFPGAPEAAFETLKKSIRSVYDGRFHLVRDSAGREEMFDVRADPGETRNLVGADGEDLHKMRKLLDAK